MIALGVLAGGCSGAAAGGPDDDGGTVRLVIPDGNLRMPGDPCNGAGAFRFAHAEAGYAIENPDGAVVSSGELPGGTAEKMMDVDFREGLRQPTVCVMTFDVTGWAGEDGHLLIIDEQDGLPIQPSQADGVTGEVVIS